MPVLEGHAHSLERDGGRDEIRGTFAWAYRFNRPKTEPKATELFRQTMLLGNTELRQPNESGKLKCSNPLPSVLTFSDFVGSMEPFPTPSRRCNYGGSSDGMCCKRGRHQPSSEPHRGGWVGAVLCCKHSVRRSVMLSCCLAYMFYSCRCQKLPALDALFMLCISLACVRSSRFG
jgi:hypothetical protein